MGGPRWGAGTILLDGLPVCDDYWAGPAARVVCRQLGLTGGIARQGSYFTQAGSDFVMDNVVCSGTEERLVECDHLTRHNCGPGEAAGVECGPPPHGPTAVTLVGGPTPSQGNVYINDLPVCDDFWSENDARVVCRMLGMTGGAATIRSHFGPVRPDFGMDNVLCGGEEMDILDCPHDSSHNCSPGEGAGVVCSKVWLVGGHRGTVYVDLLPVCGAGWDDLAAGVVCRQLGWAGGVSTSGPVLPPTTQFAPLTSLFCTGTENSLAHCPHSTAAGCGAGAAAGVHCHSHNSHQHNSVEKAMKEKPFHWIFNKHS